MTDPHRAEPLDEHRRVYELVLLATLWAGAAIFVVAGVAYTLLPQFERETGWSACLGLLAVASALALGHPIPSLRTVGLATRGGAAYEVARNWKRLRAVSAALSLLTLFSLAVLFVALLGRLHVLHWGFRSLGAHAVIVILAVTVVETTAGSLYVSLRTPTDRPYRVLGSILFHLVLALSLLVALLAAYVLFRPFGSVLSVTLGSGDMPFLLLAAAVGLGIATRISRFLPSFVALFVDQQDYYRKLREGMRRKSIVASTSVAFFLLVVVVLLVIVFQVGLVGLVQEIPKNGFLMGIVGVVLVALVIALVVSLSALKTEKVPALITARRNPQERFRLVLLWSSGSAATVLFLIALLLFAGVRTGALPFQQRVWIDFFSFGILAAIAPFGFYHGMRTRRIRLLEERFPDFLRDITAGRKAGLTMEAAVKIAARGEYGELTPEIQRMASQLSWNVPFQRVLDEFADRVDTPLIRRAVTVIREAGRTGGHVTDVLAAAAGDARELKNLENERRQTMGLYTMIVYITFLVFLGVAAVLYGTFVPQLLKAGTASASGNVGTSSALSFASLTKMDFRMFYFLASLIQGLGNGIIAGVLGAGSAASGLRHAAVMVLVSYVLFAVVL